MAATTFAERLAYARLWRHHNEGEAPTNADIGRAVKRTGQSVTSWMERAAPPPFHDIRAPLARYLGVTEAWLFDGEGEPPQPELWRNWLAKHRHRASRDSAGAHQRKRGA